MSHCVNAMIATRPKTSVGQRRRHTSGRIRAMVSAGSGHLPKAPGTANSTTTTASPRSVRRAIAADIKTPPLCARRAVPGREVSAAGLLAEVALGVTAMQQDQPGHEGDADPSGEDRQSGPRAELQGLGHLFDDLH